MDVGLGTFGRGFEALAGGCGRDTGHGFVFVVEKRKKNERDGSQLFCLSYLRANALETPDQKEVTKKWQSMALFRGVSGRERYAVRSTMRQTSGQNTCISIPPFSVCFVSASGQATDQSVLEIGV
jgi:hypothetical protein